MGSKAAEGGLQHGGRHRHAVAGEARDQHHVGNFAEGRGVGPLERIMLRMA